MQVKSSQKYFVGVLSSLTLIHAVRGKQEAKQEDGIFFPIFIMENGCWREGTFCAPNISRVCAALQQAPDEANMHKCTVHGCFPTALISHHSLAERDSKSKPRSPERGPLHCNISLNPHHNPMTWWSS